MFYSSPDLHRQTQHWWRILYHFILPSPHGYTLKRANGVISLDWTFSCTLSVLCELSKVLIPNIRYLCKLCGEKWTWSCPCSSPPCSSDSGALLCCDDSWDRPRHSCGRTACTAPCWSGTGGHAGCSGTLGGKKETEKFTLVCICCTKGLPHLIGASEKYKR